MAERTADTLKAGKEGSAPVSFEMQMKLLLQQAALAHHHPPEYDLSSTDKDFQGRHRSLKVSQQAFGERRL